MKKTVYHNNDVEIISEEIDSFEAKINVNGKNLIWISLPELNDFSRKLSTLLDEYRI